MLIEYSLKNKHENGIIEDQKQVTETLANYFSTIASDIGGNRVISLSENEFNNRSSVQMIETIYSNSSFQFKHVNTRDAQDSFKNLNPSDPGLRGYLTISDKSLQQMYWNYSNWPAKRKMGELTPISKEGDKHNVEIIDLRHHASDYWQGFWITA